MNSYYSRIAKCYDCSHQCGSHWKKLNAWELSFVFPHLKPSHRVLEVGCGSGILLKEVSPKVAIAIGIDSSLTMVELAKKKGCIAWIGDVEKELPIQREYEDLVYCFKVFPHLKEQRKALVEMARVLKPNGLLFFDFYNKCSLRWLTKKFSPTKTFTQYQNKKEVLALLPQNLSVIQIAEGGLAKSHIVIGVKKNA